jgi:hypothetical protein
MDFSILRALILTGLKKGSEPSIARAMIIPFEQGALDVFVP